MTISISSYSILQPNLVRKITSESFVGSVTSYILMDIMDKIEGKEFKIVDLRDTFFFVTAMDVCRNHLHDKDLALRVNNLLHTGNNYDLMGDSYKESIY